MQVLRKGLFVFDDIVNALIVLDHVLLVLFDCIDTMRRIYPNDKAVPKIKNIASLFS